MSEQPVHLVAISEIESEARVWMGLLRDKELSLRSKWVNDCDQAIGLIQDPGADLVVCSVQPHMDLVRLCESRNIILLIFTDATAHQAASWLGNGATSVMPHAQMAAMVPLTLRALKQRELLTQARRNTALKSEHEARLNLLLKRSSMALAYLSDTHFLSVSDGWAHWLGASTDNLVNQPWIEALPEQLRGDFQGLVTRAQLGDGVEAQVVYNQLPRILRVEPATHAGRECLMATLTAPSTKAAVGVNDRVSDGGIQRTIDALQSRLEQGQAQCLAVLEVKSVASLRHALSLVDFAELMGLVQAKMAEYFQQPPEPINDHTFLVSVASEPASTQAQGQQLIAALQAAPLATSLPMVEAALAVIEIQAEDQDVTAILQQSYDLAGRLNPGEIEVQSNGAAPTNAPDPIEALEEALKADRCELLYQPLVALSAIEGEYYEVLTQLKDADGQAIPARDFIRDAGRLDLGQLLDEQVVQRSLEALSQHQDDFPATRLMINLTLASLQREDLIDWVEQLSPAIDPKHTVVWQVRETDVALDGELATKHVKGLQNLGYQVCCAQFGNLPQPTELIGKCGFDWVKLDPSFVTELKHRPDKQTELIELCAQIREMDTKIIVPMIEDGSAMAALYQAKADLMQGNYLQPPAPEMSFEFATEI